MSMGGIGSIFNYFFGGKSAHQAPTKAHSNQSPDKSDALAKFILKGDCNCDGSKGCCDIFSNVKDLDKFISDNKDLLASIKISPQEIKDFLGSRIPELSNPSQTKDLKDQFRDLIQQKIGDVKDPKQLGQLLKQSPALEKFVLANIEQFADRLSPSDFSNLLDKRQAFDLSIKDFADSWRASQHKSDTIRDQQMKLVHTLMKNDLFVKNPKNMERLQNLHLLSHKDANLQLSLWNTKLRNPELRGLLKEQRESLQETRNLVRNVSLNPISKEVSQLLDQVYGASSSVEEISSFSDMMALGRSKDSESNGRLNGADRKGVSIQDLFGGSSRGSNKSESISNAFSFGLTNNSESVLPTGVRLPTTDGAGISTHATVAPTPQPSSNGSKPPMFVALPTDNGSANNATLSTQEASRPAPVSSDGATSIPDQSQHVPDGSDPISSQPSGRPIDQKSASVTPTSSKSEQSALTNPSLKPSVHSSKTDSIGTIVADPVSVADSTIGRADRSVLRQDSPQLAVKSGGETTASQSRSSVDPSSVRSPLSVAQDGRSTDMGFKSISQQLIRQLPTADRPSIQFLKPVMSEALTHIVTETQQAISTAASSIVAHIKAEPPVVQANHILAAVQLVSAQPGLDAAAKTQFTQAIVQQTVTAASTDQQPIVAARILGRALSEPAQHSASITQAISQSILTMDGQVSPASRSVLAAVADKMPVADASPKSVIAPMMSITVREPEVRQSLPSLAQAMLSDVPVKAQPKVALALTEAVLSVIPKTDAPSVDMLAGVVRSIANQAKPAALESVLSTTLPTIIQSVNSPKQLSQLMTRLPEVLLQPATMESASSTPQMLPATMKTVLLAINQQVPSVQQASVTGTFIQSVADQVSRQVSHSAGANQLGVSQSVAIPEVMAAIVKDVPIAQLPTVIRQVAQQQPLPVWVPALIQAVPTGQLTSIQAPAIKGMVEAQITAGRAMINGLSTQLQSFGLPAATSGAMGQVMSQLASQLSSAQLNTLQLLFTPVNAAVLTAISAFKPEMMAALLIGLANMGAEKLTVFLNALQTFSPPMLTAFMTVLGSLSAKNVQVFMQALALLSADQLQAFMGALAKLSPRALQAFVTLLAHLPQDQLQAFMGALAKLSPKQIALFTTMLAQLPKDQLQALMTALGRFSPRELQVFIRVLGSLPKDTMQALMSTFSKLSPDQLGALISLFKSVPAQHLTAILTNISHLKPEVLASVLRLLQDLGISAKDSLLILNQLGKLAGQHLKSITQEQLASLISLDALADKPELLQKLLKLFNAESASPDRVASQLKLLGDMNEAAMVQSAAFLGADEADKRSVQKRNFQESASLLRGMLVAKDKETQLFCNLLGQIFESTELNEVYSGLTEWSDQLNQQQEERRDQDRKQRERNKKRLQEEYEDNQRKKKSKRYSLSVGQ